MNRQYVGARYVPKFSDVNEGVWDSSYSYEPLTIVKHGIDFYTSKIPVPVGVDISNSEYWVLTGNYNGAITQILERIDSLEKIKTVNKRDDINTLECEVGDIIHAFNCYNNDGIESYWIVTDNVADGYLSVDTQNNLCAELIHGKHIHAHMVGAYPNTTCKDNIDAILSSVDGAQVYFDNGTYNFDGRIWLESNQSLIGSGWNTVLYCTQDPVEDHGEFIGIIHDNGNPVTNCTLKDFSIDMYTGSGEDVNGIGIVNAKNVLIQNINIKHTNWRGIQLETGVYPTENVIIKDCEIRNTPLNGIGISHTSGGSLKNIVVDNVKIYNPGGGYGGILVSGIENGSSYMKNIVLNNIYIHTTNDMPRGIYVLNAHNVKLNNITIETSATSTAYVYQLHYATNVISNNISIIAEAVTNDLMGIGILNGENLVFNNMLINGTDLGIRIPTTAGSAQNVSIANSIIESLRYYLFVDTADTVGLATGILSSKTSSITSSVFKEITAA